MSGPIFMQSDQSLMVKLRHLNWGLVLLIFIIASIGFAALYSAAGGSWDPWASRQMQRFIIGMIGMFIIALIDIKWWYKLVWPAYFIGIALLIVVELMGHVGMGAQRWINLGFMKLQPSEVIAIERCSFTTPGRYLNARGEDTSEYHAKLDYLFMHHDKSIGIGDGGNEIGMGNLNRQISTVKALPNEPATTTVSELVIASVSNWGGYGLIAALSLLAGWNLLPSVEEEEHVIRAIVGNGAIDAKAGKIYPRCGITRLIYIFIS